VEPSRDAHSRGALGAPEPSGHLGEGKLVRHAKRDGSGGVGRKLVERRRQHRADRAQVRQLLDARERRVVEGGPLDVQPAARAIVDPLSPQRVLELMARDADQPGERRRAGVAVPPPGGERGEGLRGEVGGILRVPGAASDVGEQALGVAVVEDPERLRIPRGRCEQRRRFVPSPVRCHDRVRLLRAVIAEGRTRRSRSSLFAPPGRV
jgi:hypothetical protein